MASSSTTLIASWGCKTMPDRPCPFCDAEKTDLKMIVMQVVDTDGNWMLPDWLAHCWYFHATTDGRSRQCWCGRECLTLRGFRAHVQSLGGLHQHATDYLMGVKNET